jgi:hypothetical protein
VYRSTEGKQFLFVFPVEGRRRRRRRRTTTTNGLKKSAIGCFSQCKPRSFTVGKSLIS